MYLNKEKIRCGSLVAGGLSLVASGFFFAAIFLPWWDAGSAKELFNLDNAPPAIATLWGFRFLNPPSWVTSPRPRAASTWAAYCERDAQSSVPDEVVEEPLDTSNATGDSTTIFEWWAVSSTTSLNDTTTFTSTLTRTLTITSTTATSLLSQETPFDLVPKEDVTTSPPPDNALHPGTCELIVFMPTLLCSAAALGPAAVLCFLLARSLGSLLGLLSGALLAASAGGGGAAALFLAGLLSFRGLLSATGPQMVVTGTVFAAGGAVLAVFTSVKALNQEPSRLPTMGGEMEDSDEDPEEERTPEAKTAKDQQRKAELKLPRLERFKVAREREARKKLPSNGKAGAGKPEAMMKVLKWGRGKGQGGRFGKPVPKKWLEHAFREIDKFENGVITLEQFMEAVARCGYKTSRASFERVLEDMNQDRAGELDLPEFVRFFRLVEEGLKKEARGKSRAMLSLYLCNVCFFAHVIVMCTILLITVRRESAAGEELSAVELAEGQLLTTCFQLVSVSLFGFFVSVVAVPLLRVTVGSSISAWCHHWRGTLREWRAWWRGEELEPEEEEPSGPNSPTNDLEAPAMQRRPSVASLASEGSAASARNGRRSSRISLQSGRSRTSVGSTTSQPGFLKRLLWPKAKRRKRRASRVEDSAYAASKFEEANLRAMAALEEPVSTFSPMQVRNLHQLNLPTVVPPESLAPYLPGGVYSRSESELDSRPQSRASRAPRTE